MEEEEIGEQSDELVEHIGYQSCDHSDRFELRSDTGRSYYLKHGQSFRSLHELELKCPVASQLSRIRGEPMGNGSIWDTGVESHLFTDRSE